MSRIETVSPPSERLPDAKEQMNDLGRTGGKKLDEARHWAADGVQTAAASVRAAGRQRSDATGGLARDAADKLDSTAAYVRSHDAGGVFADLQEAVRRHPTALFVIAATIGFFAGAAIRRKTQAHDQ